MFFREVGLHFEDQGGEHGGVKRGEKKRTLFHMKQVDVRDSRLRVS